MTTQTETKLNLMGIREIAALVGVPAGTISVWRNRGHLPEPEAVLACGPIWRAATIKQWNKTRKVGP